LVAERDLVVIDPDYAVGAVRHHRRRIVVRVQPDLADLARQAVDGVAAGVVLHHVPGHEPVVGDGDGVVVLVGGGDVVVGHVVRLPLHLGADGHVAGGVDDGGGLDRGGNLRVHRDARDRGAHVNGAETDAGGLAVALGQCGGRDLDGAGGADHGLRADGRLDGRAGRGGRVVVGDGHDAAAGRVDRGGRGVLR